MSAKNSRSTVSPEATALNGIKNNPLHDIGRQQMSLAAHTAAILFHGTEMIRQIQQEAAREATERHEAMAENIAQDSTPAQMMALQSELLNFDLQSGAKYWQSIASALIKTQVELMACATHAVDARSSDGMKPALEAWNTTLNNLANGSNARASAH
ncbi:MAG: phasin family protein [Pseudomonadota bacterium]